MSAPENDAALARTRLEELRTELRAERISWGELAELQGLAGYIDAGDVELLEAAGVPEFDDGTRAFNVFYTPDDALYVEASTEEQAAAEAWRIRGGGWLYIVPTEKVAQ